MEEKDLQSLSLDELLRMMISLTDTIGDLHKKFVDHPIIKEMLAELQLVQRVIVKKSKETS